MGETQRIDILAEKATSNVCWFSGIYISVASGSSLNCRRVPGKHLVLQRNHNENHN